MSGFFIAYALTITIETIVLYLLMNKQYPIPLIIRNSIIASSITLPFVWFMFPVLGLVFGFNWIIQTILAELFASGIETGIYRMLFGKMNWMNAARASFICNILSFGIGLIAMGLI